MRISKSILASGLLLAASPLFGATVAVGSCQPGKTSFATIQQAATAAPSGTTISVCPGIYPEQVTINKSFIIKGFTSGNNGAAIITAPSGGMVQNATGIYGDPIEAQIYAQGAITVTISDLTLDAANSQLDGLGCAADPVGIYFQNASGTITRNSVINDVLSPGLAGCQGGLGILAESTGNSNVAISLNSVQNYQKNGITVDGFGTSGLTATITSNTIIGQGPTTGAAENSIQVAYGASGSITSNTLGSDVWSPDVFGDTGDAAAGILVFSSPNVNIKSNNISNTQYGIAIVSDSGETADGAIIGSNTISTTHLYDAIDLCSNNNVVTANKIDGADESGIHLDSSCTGASTGSIVKTNTINSACAGVLVGASSTGTTSPNTYFNVVNLQMPGTDICAPAPTRGSKQGATKSHGRFRPAKP
jgi:hypothetical protein